MGKRNGLSRGDARRNARLIRLRGVVRHDRAILAIDLADTKQALVVCDHDSRVLARRTVRGHAWQLEEALRRVSTFLRQVPQESLCRGGVLLRLVDPHRGRQRRWGGQLADEALGVGGVAEPVNLCETRQPGNC
jgi:hypothetical protein